MVISEVVTLLIYVISIAFLPEYFGTFSTPILVFLELMVNLRSFIRALTAVCLEGGCYCRHKCIPAVHHQADP